MAQADELFDLGRQDRLASQIGSNRSLQEWCDQCVVQHDMIDTKNAARLSRRRLLVLGLRRRQCLRSRQQTKLKRETECATVPGRARKPASGER